MCGLRDLLFEFWDPLISRERLKLENSNLAGRRTAVSSNEKNAKLSQKGSCGGQVSDPLFGILGLLISREWLMLDSSNLAGRRMAVSTNKKCKISQKSSSHHLIHFWNFATPLISRERFNLETSN